MNILVTMRDYGGDNEFRELATHLAKKRFRIWTVPGSRRPDHLLGGWIYFVYRGEIRGRARITGSWKGPGKLRTGRVTKPNQWWVEYSHPMQLPRHHIRHDSFQKCRYTTPQQEKLFRRAFPSVQQSRARAGYILPLGDETSIEGRQYLARHMARERKTGEMAKRLKDDRLARTGRLECEVCRFDFAKCYGDYGQGYIECHHNVPLCRGERKTKYRDLRLVCANCHRMLHRNVCRMTIKALQKWLSPAARKALRQLVWS